MKDMFNRFKLWTTALALGACICAAAQASVVLSSQGPDTAGDLYVSVTNTQNAESFNLSSAANITGFRWYGTLAATTDLVVRTFGSGLSPNPDNYTTQTGLSGATLTRSASAVFTLGSGPLAFDVYEYELTLDSAFASAANQNVYVSIFSQAGDWGWLSSLQGDGLSAVRGANGTAWQLLAPDLTLTVLGDSVASGVPEPATLALAGLALACAAAARRRPH